MIEFFVNMMSKIMDYISFIMVLIEVLIMQFVPEKESKDDNEYRQGDNPWPTDMFEEVLGDY